MACCLMTPSHYVNQCWLNISKFSDIHLKAISQEIPQPSITEFNLKIVWRYHSNLPGANKFTKIDVRLRIPHASCKDTHWIFLCAEPGATYSLSTSEPFLRAKFSSCSIHTSIFNLFQLIGCAPTRDSARWHDDVMETLSALLTICEGNPSITGLLPSQMPKLKKKSALMLSLLLAWTSYWQNKLTLPVIWAIMQLMWRHYNEWNRDFASNFAHEC